MEKIKVLNITGSFPTKINTVAAIFILNQLEAIKKFCDIKVIFPCPYAPKLRFLPYYKISTIPPKEIIKGIEVYHPRYFMISPFLKFNNFILGTGLFFESLIAYFCSNKIIKKIKQTWDFDIIHLHGQILSGISGIFLKKKSKKPLFITLYGEDITRYSKMPILNMLSKYLFINANFIICVSNSLKKEICAMGINPKKIHVIPSGYIENRFKVIDTIKCRHQLGIKDKKVVLFVGSLIERKGVEYLIKAMNLVSIKMNDIVCYIVGTGPKERKLRELSRKLKIEKNVIFVGQKSPKDIPLWMNACDLFVLPSLNEGLANVLYEALACGKPIVVTNVGGTSEITTKDVGFLVKPKDHNDLAEKILKTLNKKWNKSIILKNAKKYSAKVSAKKLYRNYLDFVKKSQI